MGGAGQAESRLAQMRVCWSLRVCNLGLVGKMRPEICSK